MENTLEKYREHTNWTDWYMSGGCYTFADALYHYNKKRGTFFAVEEKDTDTMAHVVLYVNGEYCDYNGCRTKSEILNDVNVNYPIQWRKVNRNEVISQWNYDANEVKKITNKLKEIDMKLTKSQLKEIIREEIKQLNESISDKFINFFKRVKPGRVIIRDSHNNVREIYVIKRVEDESDFGVYVFKIGTISKNYKGKVYASLVHNEKSNVVGIKHNTDDFQSYRLPTSIERKLIKIAMNDTDNDMYVKNAISKIGSQILI